MNSLVTEKWVLRKTIILQNIFNDSCRCPWSQQAVDCISCVTRVGSQIGRQPTLRLPARSTLVIQAQDSNGRVQRLRYILRKPVQYLLKGSIWCIQQLEFRNLFWL